MAKTKTTGSDVMAEDRIVVALERIAIAVERISKANDAKDVAKPDPAKVKAAETLNAPTGPIPKYEPPAVKEGPVGTLAEETAKLHAAVERQKEAPRAEPPKVDAVAGLLGEEPAPAVGRMATFEEARAALMNAAQDRPKGIGADKVLAVLKETLGVERLSVHPKEDKAGFGRFVAALEAAVGPRK